MNDYELFDDGEWADWDEDAADGYPPLATVVATPFTPGYNYPVQDEWFDDNDAYGWDEPVYIAQTGQSQRPLLPLQQRVLAVLAFTIVIIVAFAVWVGPWRGGGSGETAVAESAPNGTGGSATGDQHSGQLAPFFMPSVLYWESLILDVATEFNVDPNMVATIMQIESCGDPQAVSIAGAQGLFQVMPFHFVTGENMQDPVTNARRGINYFAERLVQTGGEVGRAFAGYNGGHVAAASSMDQWSAETQRYYTWSTGIYAEAQAGGSSSATLEQWLMAGGASLCQQAVNRLGLN